MARVTWWLCILVALFMPGVALAQQAESEAIPKLADNTAFLEFRRQLIYIDVKPWPLSYLEGSYPFKAVYLDVYGLGRIREHISENELKQLTDFSRRAMQARLAELGVDKQIEVFDASPLSVFRRPPPGLTGCDVLHVSFYIAQEGTAAEGGAVAVSLLAWQESPIHRNESGELICGPGRNGPPWVVHDGPRLFIVQDDTKTLDQSRTLILDSMDRKLVDAIVRTNEAARATFQKMLHGRE